MTAALRTMADLFDGRAGGAMNTPSPDTIVRTTLAPPPPLAALAAALAFLGLMAKAVG